MKIDKRIVKTKASIKSSLLEIAQDKKIEDITVSELTARADVNRSTFYLHYNSIINVLEDIEQEIAEKVSKDLDAFDINDIYGSTYKMLVRLTSTLDGIPTLKKCVVYSENSPKIINTLKQIFTDQAKNAILNEFPYLSEDDVKYPLTYVSSGIVESYLKWVRSGDTKPLEVLIAEVGKITVNILQAITKKSN